MKREIEIFKTLCSMLITSPEEIRGKSRKREIVQKRQIICCILREEGLSYQAIGGIVNRDHTTVMHSVQTIQRDIKTDERAEDVLWDALLFVQQMSTPGRKSDDAVCISSA